ncbi:MAG: DUF389 domain-containing protein [Bacteroidetes bacterium]|nr:MAG: DUF389 domain-containing protein [Bacteroidota bacterium]
MQNILKYYFDLRADQEETAAIKESIQTGCEFKGTNLWALVAAILIASVGLNTNSTAVIIGAMLISPLMGPIVGTGFALSTFDFELLKTAGRNFLTFVFISLLTSTLFFGLSPFDDPTPEMDARTYPTIYDVLIGFFGGIAGIVAYTRKEKGSNIIPGVAIATALMPPLCTAGYGLANWEPMYLAGALYLFVINSVMIAFATMLVTKLALRIRRRQYEEGAKKRVTRIVAFVIICTILPSLWLAYNLYRKNDFDKHAQDFLTKEVETMNIPILKTKVSYGNNSIEVFSLGEPDSLTQQQILNRRKYYSLDSTAINFKSAREYIVEKERAYRNEAEQQLLIWRDSVHKLNTQLNEIDVRKAWEAKILTEIAAVDTNITAFGVVPMYYQTGKKDSLVTVLISCKQPLDKDHDTQIQRFLTTKFDSLKVEVEYAVEQSNIPKKGRRK